METKNTGYWQWNQLSRASLRLRRFTAEPRLKLTLTKVIIFWGSLIAISGCGDPQKLDLSPKPLFTSGSKLKTVDFGTPTAIKLRNDGETVHVGDSSQKALNLYMKPKKSFEFRDLPLQFGEGFRAIGWESDFEGYGIITFDDPVDGESKVALAVRTMLKVDEDRVQKAIDNARYEARKETQSLVGKRSRYWFWEAGRHRKMICAMDSGKNEFTLTIALGEVTVMNVMRMSLKQAVSDSRRADLAPVSNEKP